MSLISLDQSEYKSLDAKAYDREKRRLRIELLKLQEDVIKNNRKLKQISHAKKITIHTIQSNSLLQIAKALRLLAKKNALTIANDINLDTKVTGIISREFLTPLEEARLAIEEIVIAKNIAIDLFPRSSSIRRQQHELIYHYNLKGVTVGKNKTKRLRIIPNI